MVDAKSPPASDRLMLRLDGTWGNWPEEMEVPLPEGAKAWTPGLLAEVKVSVPSDCGRPSQAYLRLAKAAVAAGAKGAVPVAGAGAGQLRLSMVEVVNESCGYGGVFEFAAADPALSTGGGKSRGCSWPGGTYQL